MDVIGISKFLYAILQLVGYVFYIIGALLYKTCFRSTDTRWMVFWATVIHLIGDLLQYVFAKRWNLEIGIPDLVFLFATDAVFSTLLILFYGLPILALFAKVTPKKIEGTTFAFLTGTWNLSSTVIAPAMGALINDKFVGVSKDDLSRYDILCLIRVVAAVISFSLIFLIPMKSDIRQFRV